MTDADLDAVNILAECFINSSLPERCMAMIDEVSHLKIVRMWNYRGASLTRNSASLGLYSRTMPRALRWS